MILVDTNIPLRIAQVGHLHRQVALDALEQLTLRENERFAITAQSLTRCRLCAHDRSPPTVDLE